MHAHKMQLTAKHLNLGMQLQSLNLEVIQYGEQRERFFHSAIQNINPAGAD